MSELEKLYTVEEISIFTSLITRTIRNYLRDGILKGKKIGGQWRFTKQDIEKFMSRGEVVDNMGKEQKQTVIDFIDGVNTDIKGDIQICTIIDLYASSEIAKQKNDQFCALVGAVKDETCLTYKYNYDSSEKKARYIIFASPDFIAKAMEILK